MGRGPAQGGLLIIETSVFTKQVSVHMDDDSYRLLQIELVRNPGIGALIRGSGGLRKVRWRSAGRGKRGGVRVIYHWHRSRAILLMLLAYGKSGQKDLTAEQLNGLRAVVEEEFR
ncbi:MAG: hypothetical protein ACR2GQ_07390 [Gemmatimonadota bacterium]